MLTVGCIAAALDYKASSSLAVLRLPLQTFAPSQFERCRDALFWSSLLVLLAPGLWRVRDGVSQGYACCEHRPSWMPGWCRRRRDLHHDGAGSLDTTDHAHSPAGRAACLQPCYGGQGNGRGGCDALDPSPSRRRLLLLRGNTGASDPLSPDFFAETS